MRETFKDRHHLNMMSLMAEMPYDTKIFLRFKVGSLNDFCIKKQKSDFQQKWAIFHPLLFLLIKFGISQFGVTKRYPILDLEKFMRIEHG